jgi:hypothetical protein
MSFYYVHLIKTKTKYIVKDMSNGNQQKLILCMNLFWNFKTLERIQNLV